MVKRFLESRRDVAGISPALNRAGAALCFALAAAVFVLDSLTPLGLTTGGLYAGTIVVALLLCTRRTIAALTAVCTALLPVGLMLSPSVGVPYWIVIANTLISTLLLWTTAALGLRLKRVSEEVESGRVQLAVANRELARLARSDHLTRVANRRYFDEQLAVEFRRASREDSVLSLMLLDIDYFKSYNDLAGHQAGDGCLVEVAQSIARGVRRPSDFVARYGGEEFALLLPGTDLAGAIERAEAIRQAIENLSLPHPDERANKRVTISIGVAALHPQRQRAGVTELVEAADRALYLAKNNGRNTVRAYDWDAAETTPESPSRARA